MSHRSRNCSLSLYVFLLCAGATTLLGCAAGAPDPLISAVQSGSVDATRAALDAGSAIDQVDHKGMSPLALAAVHGRGDVARLLFERGATLDRFDLLRAVYSGNVDTVVVFLEHGADVDVVTPDGLSAMLVAAGLPNGKMIEVLAEAGATVDARGPDGSTPLILASRNGYLETTRALLAAGADVHALNQAGQTALAWAVAGDHAEIATLLRAKGATESTSTADMAAMKRDAEAAGQRALLVETTGVTTSGGQLKIRVSVTNTFSEKVAGVRYLIRLRGGQGRVLDTIRQESDAEIAPGDRIMGRLDVASVYVGGESLFFEVLAFPVRVGDREMPEPKLPK